MSEPKRINIVTLQKIEVLARDIYIQMASTTANWSMSYNEDGSNVVVPRNSLNAMRTYAKECAREFYRLEIETGVGADGFPVDSSAKQ